MRGRKPKPTGLKILEGCRADRINFEEPKVPVGSADPPAWLAGLALEHWNELAPVLVRSGILSEADRPALAALCEDYRRWRDDPDDSKARDRYRRMLVEFGLTPSSRGRLKALPDRPRDELDELLSRNPARQA